MEDEAEREKALQRSNLKPKGDDDDGEEEADSELSDYEDLLNMAEEIGNQGDPDLKGEKLKVKQTRAKRALKKAVQLLESKASARGRGRGRSKGRGKGRGRSKGKGKGRSSTVHFPDLETEAEEVAEEASKKEPEFEGKEAEEEARQQVLEKAREEAEEKAKQEVAEKARQEAEQKAREQAEQKESKARG